MKNKIIEALIFTEMEMGLSTIDSEVIILFDELEIIEFNKMGCPYWYEVEECTNKYLLNKNYYQFVKMIM